MVPTKRDGAILNEHGGVPLCAEILNCLLIRHASRRSLVHDTSVTGRRRGWKWGIELSNMMTQVHNRIFPDLLVLRFLGWWDCAILVDEIVDLKTVTE